MHEQIRRVGSLSGSKNFKSHIQPIGSRSQLKGWIQRRLFRTASIALFAAGIAIVGGIHGRLVQADQNAPRLSAEMLNQDAAAIHEVLGSNKAVAAPMPIVKPTVLLAAKSTQTPDIYQITEKRQELIPFDKVIHLSKIEPTGEARISNPGSNGLLEKTYSVTYKGESAIKFTLQGQKIVRQKTDMVVIAGYTDREARALPSRSGMYTRTQEIDMVATGYSPYEGSGCGRCANGMRAGFGVVAVDPRVIPLGSKLYIDGYGYALAGDTGGAIKGRRIDLGMNTYRTANRVGRQNVHVYVLAESR